MKKNKLFCISIFLFILSVCLSACGGQQAKKNKKVVVYKGLSVYPVKVVSMKSDDDGDIIIKGKTNAPRGAKILAQSLVDYEQDENEASSTDLDNESYEKVSKGKFSVEIDVSSLYDSDDELTVGKNLPMKVFAVKGYKEKFDDYNINSNLRKAIKKAKIKTLSFKADKKLVDFYKDDEEDKTRKSKTNSKESKPIVKKKLQIFSTRFNQVGTDGTDIVLQGTTDAPDGSIIVAQSKQKTWKDTNMVEEIKTVKSKNHSFKISVDSNGLYGKTVHAGDELPVRVLAISNYTGKTPINTFSSDLLLKFDSSNIDYGYVTIPKGLIPGEK